ncbi:MAG TPA: T9SS type A sorting domain-containing protein, partial [Bacteroidales bacterium]|nr:T9SS type A sorting domain-containing protein [Bacteroidales bacterium]
SGNSSDTLDCTVEKYIDAHSPVISSLVASTTEAGSKLNVNDVVTFTLTLSEAAEAGGELRISPTSFNGETISWSTSDNTVFTSTYTVAENNPELTSVQLTGVTFSDLAGNVSNTVSSNTILKSIDSHTPVISSVVSNATGGGTLKVGESITFTVDIATADGSLTIKPSTYNSKSLTWQTNNGGDTYFATYTIVEGDTDQKVSYLDLTGVHAIDPSGNSSDTLDCTVEKYIDANTPVISSVSLKNMSKNIGDQDTLYITINADANYTSYSLVSGTVAGYAISSIEPVNSTTIRAFYAITERSYSIDSSETMEVRNLQIADGAGNKCVVFENLNVANDNHAIFSKRPEIKLTGKYNACEGDSIEFNVQLSGYAPWNFSLSNGVDVLTFNNVESSVYTVKVPTDKQTADEPDTITYYATSLIDGSLNTGKFVGNTTLYIYALPTVNITYPLDLATYNNEAANDTLEANIAGGTFFGQGVISSLNKFAPSEAGIGDWKVYYEYTNTHGCASTDSITLRVIAARGSIEFPDLNGDLEEDHLFCDYASPFIVQGINENDVAGRFTISPNVAGALTDSTKNHITVNPSVLTAGTYTLNYTYNDGGIIEIFEGFTIESVGTNINFTTIGDYCADYDTIFIEAFNLSPIGGYGEFTFSGGNSNMVVDPNDPKKNHVYFLPGAISPAANYELSYIYTTQNGCVSNPVSKTFDINPLPSPTLNMNSVYNYNGGEKIIDATPSSPAGVFGPTTYVSGYAAGQAILDPQKAGIGSFKAWYRYTDINGCVSTDTAYFDINEPDATFVGIDKFGVNNQYCYFNSTPDTITVNVNATSWSNGKFYIDGDEVTQFNTDSIVFDPTGYIAGNHTLKYTYVANSVDYMIETSLNIDSIGIFNFTGLDVSYCEDDINPNSLILIPPSGNTGTVVYSGNGIVANTFVPSLATAGNHIITAQFTRDNTGCIKYTDNSTVVNSLPEVNLPMDAIYNIDGGNKTVIPSVPGGDYSPLLYWSNITSSSADFDPQIAGLGRDTVYYRYTDGNGCTNTDTAIFTITEANASFVGIDQYTYQSKNYNQYCYFNSKVDTITVDVVAASWSNGKFYIDEAEQNLYSTDTILFNPVDLKAGTHELKYTYIENGVDYFIETSFNIDSIGDLEIIGLSKSYCHDDGQQVLLTGIAPGEPGVGIFSGNGILVNKFIPTEANLGDNTITYTFVRNHSGCIKSVDSVTTINIVPFIDFDVDKTCIVNRQDSVTLISDTLYADNVVEWSWNVDNTITNRTSKLEKPKFSLVEQVKNFISLTVTTDKGCSAEIDKSIFIGSVVELDFKWDNECFGEEVNFKATSFTDPIGVDSVKWSFGGVGTADTSDAYNPSFLYQSPGVYNVVYKEYTSNCGLVLTTKSVNIRPSIDMELGAYFEDFEAPTNITGWAVDILNSSENYSWQWGIPSGEKIDTAASGLNAYVTNLDGNYSNNEISYVSSPCFDFTQMEKPMLSFDFISDLELNKDGVILEYSVTKDEWNTVGVYGEGVNWYNSFGIGGSVLGQSSGWTGDGKSLNTSFVPTWNNARYWLDDLKGHAGVQFRFVLGTDNSTLGEGFGFDNIQIGERNRLVLLEHFANPEENDFENTQSLIENISSENKNDVTTIQYFTSFPKVNEISEFYAAGPSARSLYYGVSQVPYSIIDGGDRKFNYSSTNTLDGSDIKKRMLQNSVFYLDVKQGISGENLNISTTVKAIENIEQADYSVRILVGEKSVLSNNFNYYNILRAMLPDPAGTLLERSWNADDSVKLFHSWVIPSELNADSLFVIAFIQNEDSKEIYQAAYTSEFGVLTSDNEFKESLSELDYLVYPNPANETVNLKFIGNRNSDLKLNIYNNTGYLVKTVYLPSDIKDYNININDLPVGIYFLKLDDGYHYSGTTKIIKL